MPLSRSTPEILGLYADALRADIKKVLPATVTAVHADRQTVDVQIAINLPLFTDLGDVVTEPAPSISDVPCGVLRGGGFFVWVPLAVGDSVLLVFSDLSCDTWRSGEGQPQDPGFMGLHTMDSAFAIPMVGYDSKFFSDPANAPTKLIIGKDGSAAQIRLSDTDIELGNAVTDTVALATLVKGELQKIATAFSTFIPGSGGASFPDAYLTPSDVGSTLIKGQ